MFPEISIANRSEKCNLYMCTVSASYGIEPKKRHTPLLGCAAVIWVISKVKSELHAVELDAGAHGGGEYEALNIGTLRRCGLCLNDSVHQSVEVLADLFFAEADLTDGAVADVGLINAVFNFTCFDIGDCLCNIHGDGAALGVGHQALRAENAADSTDNAHHIGSCNADIKTEPVFGLNLFDHIFIADEIRARFLCFASLVALCKNENANNLTGAVGQNDCAANLLVCVTGVNAQTDMRFNGFVELCLCGGKDYGNTLFGIIELLIVERLCAFDILLPCFIVV